MSTNPTPYPGGGGASPWQFRPESYGAKANGRICVDVTTTNLTSTFTSPTISADAAAVGKTVMINGANGTASAPLIDTIASASAGLGTFTTTTKTAGISTSGCQAVWGSDDQAAINLAVAAGKAYALANNYEWELLLSCAIYMACSAPVQASGAGGQVNSQIPMPYPNVNGTTPQLVSKITGVASAGQAQYFESTFPNLQASAIVSTQTAPLTPDATYGVQSVIGGPSSGSAFTGGFANTKVVLDGVSVFCPIYTNIKAYNFGFMAGQEWGSFSSNIFAPALAGTHPQLTDLPSQGAFQATRGVGCIFPYIGNNDNVNGRRFCSEGYETNVVSADHFTCVSLATVYSDLAWLIDTTQGSGGGNSHQVSVLNWSNEAYNGGLNCNGGYVTVNICMDTETLGGNPPSYDVQDAGGNLHGVFRIADADGRSARVPVVTNCQNLKVINDMMGPGYWSGAPSVPLTTVAQQNTSARDAWITITSGGAAVTVIAVDGQATGLTLGASGVVVVRVPSLKNITLTYASTAPTWKWWLD